MARVRALLTSDSIWRPLGWLRDRSAVALGRLLAAYLGGLSRSIRTAGLRELATLVPGDGARPFLCYRNQDVLALMLALCLPNVEEHLGEVEVVCDDSFPGRVTATLTEGLGRQVRWLRRTPFGQRARDLQGIMRSRRPLGIVVDTGGPYGEVRPSLLQLGVHCEARLVPVVARVSRAVPFWQTPPLGLPLPGATLAVALGRPVAGAGLVALEDLREGFAQADERAREALVRPVRSP